MNAPVKLSVVISFFNEEDVLPELVRRLRDVLRQERDKGMLSGYELIFVNDSSTDRSEEILMAQAKGRDDIKIITMSRNFGVSQCVLAGMEYSTGDLIVYMDADLQDPPETIPDMLSAWKEGKDVDVVNTVRLDRKGESLLKRIFTRIGYRVLKSVININFLVEAGDFKLLSRRAVNHLLLLREKQPFLRGLVYWIGFNQTTVHYHRQGRYSGKTKFPIFNHRVINNFLFSALISFSDVPLKFSLLAGAVTAFFSFCFLIYVLVQKFVLAHTTPGWTAIMAVMSFMGGMQLLIMGIVGLYINSIFLESKKRPNYIVSRISGFDKNKVLP